MSCTVDLAIGKITLCPRHSASLHALAGALVTCPVRMPFATLVKARHGKARVRVAKVIRGKQERFAEYTVQLELIGGTEASFLHGDNHSVISTDTCKNHVYLHAKHDRFESPESFGVALAKRMLRIYGHIDKVLIVVEETPWARLTMDAMPHCHGFIPGSDVHGCLTTKSGWAGFLKDRYTTLPETDERILATEINAEWGCREGVDYQRVYSNVKAIFMRVFFGPTNTGVFSKGVQETLYGMGSAVVRGVREVEDITISLPNIHFLPCNIPVFAKNGVKFEDDVFIPSAEPHGIITATVERSRAKL